MSTEEEYYMFGHGQNGVETVWEEGATKVPTVIELPDDIRWFTCYFIDGIETKFDKKVNLEIYQKK